MLEEPDQVRQCDVGRFVGTRQGRGKERGGLVAGAQRPLDSAQGMPVEAERALRAERLGNEVPGVERLQRVVHDDLLARPAAALAGHDRVDRVEDFTHGYGGQPDSVRPSIGSGVEDHQVLPGREHGVEQQLPVLGTWVALTDARVAAENVVAIDAGAARELAVVQAEQADHAVRHRTHRHHGAHGQVPGPEVRPGGSARQPLGEQGMDVGERQYR